MHIPARRDREMERQTNTHTKKQNRKQDKVWGSLELHGASISFPQWSLLSDFVFPAVKKMRIMKTRVKRKTLGANQEPSW